MNLSLAILNPPRTLYKDLIKNISACVRAPFWIYVVTCACAATGALMVWIGIVDAKLLVGTDDGYALYWLSR